MSIEVNAQRIYHHYGNDIMDQNKMVACTRFSGNTWHKTFATPPVEMKMTIYVNSQKLVNILCTPQKLKYLVLGFLYEQKVISGMDDVLNLQLSKEKGIAEVKLKNPDFELPENGDLTSGCGGGTFFRSQCREIDSQVTIKPGEVIYLMKKLGEQMELYRSSGGVHTSALATSKELILVAEDIGRHNTLDKILGECLVREIPTKDLILLCTGRISSEMLQKATKMQVPVIISRHSPTAKAISMANDMKITLIGRAREEQLVVYSYPERIE